MVELRKTPVDKSESFIIVIDHNVVWFHVSVHDAFAVAVVQGLQNFVDVKSNIHISKALVQRPEVNIAGVDVLHYQSWCLSHWVPDDVNEVDDVHTASESLKDLDFSSNLGLLDWFQDFNDNSFVINSVDAFVDF